MVIIPEEYYKKELVVKLTAQDIERITRELNMISHEVFEFLDYQKIVDKLNKALECSHKNGNRNKMSRNYRLCCRETKECLWIGQGPLNNPEKIMIYSVKIL